MTEHILIVEDEPALAQVLCEYFDASGYRTSVLGDGREVLPLVQRDRPDLMVLDLMLPGMDGLEVFRQVRAFADIPVMMATAKVEEIDRLLGLELGADDYVCKPFSPRELVVRAKNILRRSRGGEGEPSAASRLQIDEARMQARVAGQVLDLTPTEFRLLAHLQRHPGQVFSRDQLLDSGYLDHRVVTDRAVDSHIKNLRRKLQQRAPEGPHIKSVYGVGYKLE